MRKRRAASSRPTHQVVLDVLSKAGRPISAYEILDRVRPAGITAPPTIYRALNRLIEEGVVHRLESLNAFVSCSNPLGGHPHRDHAAFAICDTCGRAEEFIDATVFAALNRWADERPFRFRRAIVEVNGRCSACRTREDVDDDAPPG